MPTALSRIVRMLSAEPTDETLRGAYPALFRALRMVDLADEVLRGTIHEDSMDSIRRKLYGPVDETLRGV